MNKRIAVLMATAAMMFIGCTEGQSTQPFSASENAWDNETLTAGIAALPSIESVTADMETGLKFMREEEKVARDVYLALNTKWKSAIFANIARSEQRHMDALKVLLDRYGIADPVQTNAEGVFMNADLQRLYDELVVRGSASVKEALLVGKLIEEVDIKDLNEQLQFAGEGTDLEYVYQNLKRGSENHLAAFNRNLSRIP